MNADEIIKNIVDMISGAITLNNSLFNNNSKQYNSAAKTYTDAKTDLKAQLEKLIEMAEAGVSHARSSHGEIRFK